MNNANRIIRQKQLSEKLGVSLSTIWRWRKAGILPEPLQLGPRLIGWQETEVERWIVNRSGLNSHIK